MEPTWSVRSPWRGPALIDKNSRHENRIRPCSPSYSVCTMYYVVSCHDPWNGRDEHSAFVPENVTSFPAASGIEATPPIRRFGKADQVESLGSLPLLMLRPRSRLSPPLLLNNLSIFFSLPYPGFSFIFPSLLLSSLPSVYHLRFPFITHSPCLLLVSSSPCTSPHVSERPWKWTPTHGRWQETPC